MSKAFFLDRDGVINIDHSYVHSVDEFEIIPGVYEACQKIQQQGYKIIVVTNQAGIARGYYTEEQFSSLNKYMLDCFSGVGVNICDVYYCPHHPREGVGEYLQECECRKPFPGMILEAAEKHKIDLEQSVMVGDKASDMDAGRAAGISVLYGILGHYEWPENDSAIKVVSLLEAVDAYFE